MPWNMDGIVVIDTVRRGGGVENTREPRGKERGEGPRTVYKPVHERHVHPQELYDRLGDEQRERTHERLGEDRPPAAESACKSCTGRSDKTMMSAVSRSCEDKRHVLSVCTLEHRAHDDALGLLRRHALAYALRLALEQHRRVRCTASSAQRSNHTAFWSEQSKETTHFLSKIGCPRPAQTRPRSSSRRTTDQSQQQSSPSLRQGERKGNSPPTATGSSPRSTRR